MPEKYRVFQDNEAEYLAWLAQNPNGFVLNAERRPRAKYMPLHTARCHTIQNVTAHAHTAPFTGRGYMKVCANDPNELLAWIATQGATQFSSLCRKCKVADFMNGTAIVGAVAESGNTGDDWTEQELRASVLSYLEMQQKERAGQSFVKKQYYENLAKIYGRTAKAFEYRMQNISYVLSLMGKDWLQGLKPAKNVGKKVACQIEALVLELSNRPQAPVVAFEFEVRESLQNKYLAEPKGSKQPATSSSQVVQFQRDPLVKAWVLKKASGVCECCGHDAPFESTDGQPFLEVHHMRKLAEGGSDTVGNAVAICPNCHRALHYGIRAKELVNSLYDKISRLIRE